MKLVTLTIPYLVLHNVHWCIMHIPLLALKISRKKLVRVYNAHGLLKKIVIGNVRIKYQSYIFFQSFNNQKIVDAINYFVELSKQLKKYLT